MDAKQVKKEWKKSEKKSKRTSKLADLVCTKGFFLYKSGQISKKHAIRLLVTSCLLFVTVCKLGEMQSNGTKWQQAQRSFADAVPVP